MTTTATTPRIYVACLASYNSGTLHGEWIDADDADTMREEIATMLRASKYPNVMVVCPECDGDDEDCDKCDENGTVPSAEEFAIHDHEGFHGMIEEYTSIDDVAEIAALIEEHGPAYAAYADNVGIDYATADGFGDQYCGEWASERAYTEETFDDCNDIPDHLANYIDYDSIVYDWFACGDNYSVDNPEGGLFIFRSC